MVQRLFLCVLLLLPLFAAAQKFQGSEIEDDDFAEFEDFDDDEEFENVPVSSKKESARSAEETVKKVVMSNEAEVADDDDIMIEDEDDEFEHFTDDEEFEGFDPDFAPTRGKQDPPDLKITKVPLHLTQNWESFYLEILMLAGLAVYLLNFLAGKNKNSKLAQAWVNAHREMLEAQFSVVGDDGSTTEPTSNVLMKESENIYNLWCSGRVCTEGMLVTLKLLKRQDLISTISRMFTPKLDQILVKVTLEESMDPYVFCVAKKKAIGTLHKETQDLSWYCAEKKQADKHGIPSSFQMLNEVGETAGALLDQKVVACLNKYEKEVEYIHISDQYCGPKPQDEAPTTMPVVEKALLFCFNVPGEAKTTTKDMEAMTSLMKLVFHMLERVRRFRLSKEGKSKSEKNRQRVADIFMKQAHSQRAEAAQTRREEKRRAEKDKMMAEEDPDKQRRMEARNAKKDKKTKPHMKMVKMKSM